VTGFGGSAVGESTERFVDATRVGAAP